VWYLCLNLHLHKGSNQFVGTPTDSSRAKFAIQCNANLMLARVCRVYAPLRKELVRPPHLPSRHRTRSSMTAAGAAALSPNEQAVAALQPSQLFKFFAQLSEIPRPSKQEERVLSWLKEFAKARNLETKQDKVGNLVIRRPGSGGGEQAPTVVIQGHVDMVCEKNKDTVHDFTKDPIRLVVKGDWLHAQGTTLGADNGIGVCTALALLDMSPSTAKLPPLECLFTVDEETGLTGAFDIAPDMLEGRTMLNLDTEDWGEIFIGCAGGGDSQLQLTMPIENIGEGMASSSCQFLVNVGGLLGGHSGLMIAEGRGNALIILVRVLRRIQAASAVRVCSLSGGDKRNALPREAQAVVVVPNADVPAVQQAIAQTVEELQAEYGLLEKDLFVRLDGPTTSSPLPPNTQAMTADGLQRLCALLTLLPHGPLKFSHAVPGLVETSNNLASVTHSTPAEGGSPIYQVVCSTRSSVMSALEHVRGNIRECGRLVGAEVVQDQAYPGWQPNPHSAVLEVTKDVYAAQTKHQAKVGAIHAGLECGIIGAKFPGLDSVSFGPTIRGAHSPDECCQISTVEPFWQLTLGVLERLADKRL